MQILTVDIGTGTQDVLLFDSERELENCFKLVLPSPTVVVADRIRAATAARKRLVLHGVCRHDMWKDQGFTLTRGQMRQDMQMIKLMGANFADYIREAYRTLKLDGQLHVIEATARFTDRNGFAKTLEALGFAIVSVEDKWKFTHIRAIKTERPPRDGIEMRF